MDTDGKLIRNDKGIAAVYIALLLVMLVALAGIVIDFSYMYIAKGQLQNAADAAALAGAARLNRSAFANQSGARNEAWRFAYNNKMVPAGKSVFLIASSSYSLPPNNLNSGNDPDGDIVLGNWTQAGGFVPANGIDIVNAVKVVARRTSDASVSNVKIGDNPMSTFLGRVIGWNQMNVKAEAIALKVPAKLLPIVVNEYWLANSNDPSVPNLIPPGQQPYGNNQDYPNSFVRVTNVNGTASKVFGRTFAIIGASASDNLPSSVKQGAQSVNGYVNMDFRTSNYDGSGTSWYQLTTGTLFPNDCSSCSSLFTGPIFVVTGAVANAKFDASLQYLMNGFPDNYPFPTAVKEQYTSSYPTTAYVNAPTSVCPYATVPYFTSGGSQPINKSYNGQTFTDVYPPGKKVIAMVYDGTFKPESDPSAANVVTNVGYVPIQIDGYSSTNPKGLNLSSTGPTSGIGTGGNTAYGHALADILETSSTTGPCDTSFFSKLNSLAFQFGETKLVK